MTWLKVMMLPWAGQTEVADVEIKLFFYQYQQVGFHEEYMLRLQQWPSSLHGLLVEINALSAAILSHEFYVSIRSTM